LLTELSVTSPNNQGYSLDNGIIKYQGRVWLGNQTEAKQAILLALHNSAIGGHSGVNATYHKVRALFSWPHMKQEIQEYISKCAVCQQAKHENTKAPGLLQPIPVPDSAWSMISLDFIEGLPKSQRFDTILVIIDKSTKYAHFLPLAHPFTALSVAQVFVDNIYKLHGLPKAIISDRDKVFTSHLWKELFKLTDTTFNMSSSYHPQSDGQTERLNQCVETYLRCMTQACPSKWAKWLPLAEYWYNTTLQSAIGRTPFEALYGYKPKHFGLMDGANTSVPDLDMWLQDRAEMNKLLQQQLLRAQQRMKSQADKHRTERSFAVGEKVYLKLQPYVQSSVARRSNQKLSYKFFGPYKILQKVGTVAYKLDLPSGSQIHPVVHVSLLKKAIPADEQVVSDLPLNFLIPNSGITPLCLMDTKHVQVGKTTVPFVQVRWTSLPEHWTTWENKYRLIQEFPDAPAWGQAGNPAGGIVGTKHSRGPKASMARPRRMGLRADCG
jgi:hypothetical protein